MRATIMTPLRAYTRIAAAAVIGLCVLIVLGGAVCFRGAAKSIPDWPSTFGGIRPPAAPGALVEYLHRAGAVIVGLLVLALAGIGWLKLRPRRWLLVPPLLSLVLLAIVSTVGALVVLGSVPPYVAAVDLASALLAVALMITVALVGAFLLRHPQGRIRLGFHDPFSWLALAAALALWVVLFSSLSVGNPGPANCLGLPLWNKALFAAGSREWLRAGYFLLSGVAGALIAGVAAAAWRRRRREKLQVTYASGALASMVISVAASEMAAVSGFPWFLMTVRVGSATVLWAALSALVVREGLKASRPEATRLGTPGSVARAAPGL